MLKGLKCTENLTVKTKFASRALCKPSTVTYSIYPNITFCGPFFILIGQKTLPSSRSRQFSLTRSGTRNVLHVLRWELQPCAPTSRKSRALCLYGTLHVPLLLATQVLVLPRLASAPLPSSVLPSTSTSLASYIMSQHTHCPTCTVVVSAACHRRTCCS